MSRVVSRRREEGLLTFLRQRLMGMKQRGLGAWEEGIRFWVTHQ